MIMRILLLILTVSVFAISCSITNNFVNEFSIKDIKKNNIQKSYGKIIIGGIGSSTTRLFLEKLSVSLNKAFKEHNIQTEFIYLGNDSITISNNLSTKIPTDYFDAILFIFPGSNSEFSESQNEIFGVQPRSIKLEQSIHFKIFEKKQVNSSIWEATMDININFTKSHIYKIIARDIINSLKTNKLVL